MPFPTTQWNLLEAVKVGSEDQRRDALGKIVSIYGPPLYAFARRETPHGWTREDCEDLVSDFFLRCMESSVFERADRQRGRFRNLLAKAFHNHLRNAVRDRLAQARMPRGGLISLQDLTERFGASIEPRDAESAWDVYYRILRSSLFAETLTEFEARCRAAGQVKKYVLFLRREIEPERDGIARLGYKELAEELHLASEDAVGRIIRAAKDEFRALLLAKISDDCESDKEAEVELELVLGAGLRS